MVFRKNHRPGTTLADERAHRSDHRAWSRRSFLRTLGLAGAANVALQGLPISALAGTALTSAIGAGGPRKLVLLRLKGGNDGLNTFIPLYQYAQYQSARPSLAYAQNELLGLTDAFAMPSAMQALQPLWNNQQMRVVNSVGYPNHNLSHFTGADIMASGNSDPGSNADGWPARYFVQQNPDYLATPCPFPPAVKIGGPTSVLFNSPDQIDISANFATTAQLNALIANDGALYNNLDAPDNCYYGEQVLYLRTVANSAALYGEAVAAAYNESSTEAAYSGNLGEQLRLVARLIKGDLQTQFFLVTLDGFDTHVGQNGGGNHPGLLTELSAAVNAFYTDLAADDRDGDVLTMTYSEFGRRVNENGFGGTDHGTALPVMLFGPALGGSDFHGTPPDLTDLDATGNLRYGTDFRSIYATLLQEWLCLDATTTDTVLGDDYPRLPELGLQCLTTSAPLSPQPARAADHRLLTLGGGQYRIEFEVGRAGRIRIDIRSVDGRLVRTLTDRYYTPGAHVLDFDLHRLSVDLIPLVYVIHHGGARRSGSFVGCSR